MPETVTISAETLRALLRAAEVFADGAPEEENLDAAISAARAALGEVPQP
ncbi:hypothetical protein [Methylobacterium oryzae]|nr:hypothetical protein [Methylobacterium oryzae]UIN38392.1 hypothetical protein LXM90_30890 [Methylobacterium oryzae]